jgi:hypothetical protein
MPEFFLTADRGKTYVVSERYRDIYDFPVRFEVRKEGERWIVRETLGGAGIKYEDSLLEIKRGFSSKFGIPFDGKFLYVRTSDREEGVNTLLPLCLTIIEAWEKKCLHKIAEWKKLKEKLKENPYCAVKLRKAEKIAEPFGFPVSSLPFKFYGDRAYVETLKLLRAVAEYLLLSKRASRLIVKLAASREEAEEIHEKLTWTAAYMVAFYSDAQSNGKTKFSSVVKGKVPWLAESDLEDELKKLADKGRLTPEAVKGLIKPMAFELA